MKAGLFGGTFNPLHMAHIRIAEHVKQCLALDTIFFFPSATPPHKPGVDLAPAKDRYDMVVKSLAHKKGLKPSDIEINRKGPSFTIDTVHAFKRHYGESHQFYLLMGSDAFFDTPTWKRQKDIFAAVAIVVMPRQGTGPDPDIRSFLDEHIAKGYTWHQEERQFVHDRLQPVRICPVPRIDISSTLIRNRVKQHLSIKGLVPPPVEKIINERNLYL
ncbi:nicotinate-nucleotide adenylyltransferase [Desulfotignum balticum]|uniref:nicotinate-nucleotide adenylyltransferase n=1 Tax=Desulfotignum balticum TaxID=115781 RepID=UPI00041CD250|nr:nicotinate-nucleotide adenylyltransferase [Desulfotignum balticum]